VKKIKSGDYKSNSDNNENNNIPASHPCEINEMIKNNNYNTNLNTREVNENNNVNNVNNEQIYDNKLKQNEPDIGDYIKFFLFLILF